MKSFLLLIFTAVLMVSCGGGANEASTAGEQTASETPSTETQETAEPQAAESELVQLVINSDDMMQFDRDELKVKEGSKVELTLNHTGKMAKEAMGHNVVILKLGTDLTSFAERAIAAVDTDYIPEGDEVLVHTKMLGGGESDTVTFDAPAKGTYDFICSFPGHYALMKGKFIVE
ncbi:MAG: azurin [Bacteroidota bacterium]